MIKHATRSESYDSPRPTAPSYNVKDCVTSHAWYDSDAASRRESRDASDRGAINSRFARKTYDVTDGKNSDAADIRVSRVTVGVIHVTSATVTPSTTVPVTRCTGVTRRWLSVYPADDTTRPRRHPRDSIQRSQLGVPGRSRAQLASAQRAPAARCRRLRARADRRLDAVASAAARLAAARRRQTRRGPETERRFGSSRCRVSDFPVFGRISVDVD